MIISDLEHLEVTVEGSNVVGGNASLDNLNSALKSLGYKPVNLKLSSNSKGSKTVYKASGDAKKGSVISASVKEGKNGVSATASIKTWKNS